MAYAYSQQKMSYSPIDKNHTSLSSCKLSVLSGSVFTDNFYTGLSPHKPCVSSGFVFTSDQVCSQGSLAIRSMVGTYFPHGFGVYSHVFGVYLGV